MMMSMMSMGAAVQKVDLYPLSKVVSAVVADFVMMMGAEFADIVVAVGHLTHLGDNVREYQEDWK